MEIALQPSTLLVLSGHEALPGGAKLLDQPHVAQDQAGLRGEVADRLDLVRTGASDCHGARYDFRMGCKTTDAERFAELKRRAGR